MLTPDQVAERRGLLGASAVLTALRDRLRRRVERLRRERPAMPGKALLARDGGRCPTDGAPLTFDPWSSAAHRCPTCGGAFQGERHDGHWARAQHLWLAERTTDLATLAVLDGDRDAAERAVDLLTAYAERYFALPNRDNVLGPTHLFFSTYLESVWITQWLAGAVLLRDAGLVTDDCSEAVSRVADEAATIIGEFNEGMSNRQTWHAAALTAIAAWFEDEELGQTAIGARTGLLGHLADGFGEDGLWWEGENYHIFALRGLMAGVQWGRVLGIDLLADPELRDHFHDACLGPSRSALPDLTYPARKDARFGVSLAQPAHLELCEITRGWLGADPELDSWLAALRAAPPPVVEPWDAWLHEQGLDDAPAGPRERLSAWALLTIDPDDPAPVEPWTGTSAFLPSQGLAVLRHGDRYASLEGGRAGGGHGHPDQLHLTLHAGGTHWLPDLGTGFYVDRSLFWYRSALAHNAPVQLGGPAAGEVRAEAFEAGAEWAWARARGRDVSRTIIAGPAHLVDVVELDRGEPGLDLPWHFLTEVEVESSGRWEPADLNNEFVSDAERFVPDQAGPVALSARAPSGARLGVHLLGHDELVRARAPGDPRTGEPHTFFLQRARGSPARLVTVLTTRSDPEHAVRSVTVGDGIIAVATGAGAFTVRVLAGGTQIVAGGRTIDLKGPIPAPARPRRLLEERPGWDVVARAPYVWDPPALDGSLDGFDTSEPIELAGEHHYLRSEEPWDAEAFGARVWVNRDRAALYLAVEVNKSDLLFRPADAPPLLLDNEPDDIHSDGIQVYVRFGEESLEGFLLVPEAGGGLRVSPAAAGPADPARVDGRWVATALGYRATFRLADDRLAHLEEGSPVGFDLAVNEMRPGRVRRAGQLVWMGGGGWVYLRGDRPSPIGLGRLELG